MNAVNQYISKICPCLFLVYSYNVLEGAVVSVVCSWSCKVRWLVLFVPRAGRCSGLCCLFLELEGAVVSVVCS